MRTLNFLLAGALLLSAVPANAQPDTAKMIKNALMFADSLVKVDSLENFQAYADLTPPSVVKYYGGKNGFIDHIIVCRARTISSIVEDAPQFRMLQLRNVVNDEWQCVVQESRYFHRDDRKFRLVTYLVGQTKDQGGNWRLFDVGYNKVANIIAMFPEIFGDLEIKEAVVQNSK